jgi:hypothetical protein
LKNKK